MTTKNVDAPYRVTSKPSCEAEESVLLLVQLREDRLAVLVSEETHLHGSGDPDKRLREGLADLGPAERVAAVVLLALHRADSGEELLPGREVPGGFGRVGDEEVAREADNDGDGALREAWRQRP